MVSRQVVCLTKENMVFATGMSQNDPAELENVPRDSMIFNHVFLLVPSQSAPRDGFLSSIGRS